MRKLFSVFKRNRYDLLAFVCGGIGALLGIASLLDAWDLLHMARWLPKSWTIADVAMFRFHVGIVGAIVGCSIAGILPLYLALRANQKEAATSEKHTE